MKSESELAFEYIRKNGWQFYNSLTALEKALYIGKVKRSIDFKLFVLRQRIFEALNTLRR